ncbi:MAG TPA: amino acid aminotransferase, partial [Roseateles sp.]
MFEHVDAYAGDPILSLNEAFQKDPRAGKINLSIGIYFDNDGRIPMLPSVRAAELAVVEAAGARPYLPMEGAANFRSAVQALLFGADHPAIAAGRIATIQGVGSSGGLKVGADLLKRYFPDSKIYLSDPTWDNHRAVFEGSGHVCETYPYYDPATGGVRFDDLLAFFKQLPTRSVVLMHACCHNPTGVDLTQDQWRALVPVIRERQLLPFLDLAYQGYGDGIEEDAFAPRLLADEGLAFLIANSFSKSMSLYGERCGGLSVVCPDADQAARVLGQMKFMIRRNYSNPPMHGGQIVAKVLTDPKLRAMWEAEVKEMRERIQS